MFLLNLKIGKDQLEKLSSILFQDVFNGEHVESGGMKFDVAQTGNANIQLESTKVIATVPVMIRCRIGSGLLENEISGKAHLKTVLDYHIEQDFDITHQTSIIEINWSDDKLVRIADTNLEFEKLNILLTQHIDAFYGGRVDRNIRNQSTAKTLVNHLTKNLNNKINILDKDGIQAELQMKSIQIYEMLQKDEDYFIGMVIDAEAALSEQKSYLEKESTFKGFTQEIPELNSLLKFSTSYSSLSPLFKRYIEDQDFGGQRAKVIDLNISFDKQPTISLTLMEPVEAKVSISARPIYDERKQLLSLENLKIDLRPNSFLHKLGVPVIINLIKSRIASIFPIQLDKFLNQQARAGIEQSGRDGQKINFESIQIQQLMFTDTGLVGLLSIKELIIEQSLQ